MDILLLLFHMQGNEADTFVNPLCQIHCSPSTRGFPELGFVTWLPESGVGVKNQWFRPIKNECLSYEILPQNILFSYLIDQLSTESTLHEFSLASLRMTASSIMIASVPCYSHPPQHPQSLKTFSLPPRLETMRI